jgi:hypothetical protein
VLDAYRTHDRTTANIGDHAFNEVEQLDAFETDNVHPRFHEIFPSSEFQTRTAKDLVQQYEKDLCRTQTKIKTIFPKINQRDMIRQEVDAIKVQQ